MNKFRSTIILIFSSFIFGCATSTYQKAPSDNAISEQETILKQIYIGQKEKEVLSLLNYPIFDSFDVMESGVLFSYKELTNSDTNVEFGLLFENGKLESVILDDDASDLFSCRTMFRTHGRHWLSHGIIPYVEWIKSKDHLSKGINYRISNPETTVRHRAFNDALGDTLTVIVYSPLIVAGTPFFIYDKLTRKTENERAAIRNKYGLYRSIAIGDAENTVLQSLGEPNRTDLVNGAKVLTYTDLSYSYGIRNHVVIWKEHISMFELYSRQLKYGGAFYGTSDCGSLEDIWRAKKRVNSD